MLGFILTVPTFEMPKPLTHFKRAFFLKRFFQKKYKIHFRFVKWHITQTLFFASFMITSLKKRTFLTLFTSEEVIK